MKTTLTSIALAVGLGASGSNAQSKCQTVLVPTYSPPSVAPGWTAQLVANGLLKPRSIQLDSSGALLVVESGKGVTRLTFKDGGGTCLEVDQSTLVVNQTSLNHGLALSGDGKKLYASSVESVFAWDYDAAAGTTSGGSATVVTGMRSDDLVTRTLLMSKKHDGMLVVSRGSGEDLDPDALNIASGLGQLKAFDLSNLTSSSAPYDFDSAGRRLGWGLRNAVGVAEHPVTGGIYSVENSIDGATRNGVDIHKDNPGEELNFHGFLNGSTEDQGGNYGYPSCYALWDKSIPDAQGLDVGSQFSMAQNSTLNDDICSSDFVAPRLTFPAHYAPLDIKFTSDGATAYITFHGSFDKTNPVGYRLTSVAFDGSSGAPVAAADSTQALSDIMSNVDPSKCPGSCFRPVGIAIDSSGRVFMTSDSTGEIYVLVKSAGTPSSTASGTIVTATGSPNSAAGLWNKASAVLGGVLAAAAAVVVSI